MTLLFGHRGARGLAPENTIPSFRLAKEIGVDGVELDVHLSRDGEIIVMHDDTVNRTTNGKGRIRDMTLKEIKGLDAGVRFGEKWKGTPVPTLEEVFDALGKEMLYKVEIKHSYRVYPSIEEKVIGLAKRKGLKERVQIISFDFDSLEMARQIDGGIQLGLIIEGKPRWFLDTARKLEAGFIHGFFELIDEEDLKLCREAGVKLGVWTVNEVPQIERFCKMGIDDITGDYPDRLKQVCSVGGRV